MTRIIACGLLLGFSIFLVRLRDELDLSDPGNILILVVAVLLVMSAVTAIIHRVSPR